METVNIKDIITEIKTALSTKGITDSQVVVRKKGIGDARIDIVINDINIDTMDIFANMRGIYINRDLSVEYGPNVIEKTIDYIVSTIPTDVGTAIETPDYFSICTLDKNSHKYWVLKFRSNVPYVYDEEIVSHKKSTIVSMVLKSIHMKNLIRQCRLGRKRVANMSECSHFLKHNRYLE